MQLFIILCFVASAFALKECPENSHYNNCGTACPLTCENYQNPPKFCILVCKSGCHCDEGYVKTKDGRCVLPEDCDKPVDAVCGPNQEYKECGTACPLTCDNFDNPPKICPAMCVSGCHCQKGYVKTTEGRCVLPENCPSRAFDVRMGKSLSDVCELPILTGPCKAFILRYGFDKTAGMCKKFVYGGCHGNANKFRSLQECESACGGVQVEESNTGICELPIETGPCMALFHRYGFDKKTGKCIRFVYGGCQGNKNNFASLQECESACSASQGALDRPDCDKGAEPGLCEAYMPRYYYDQEAGMCKKFIYGGCGGNRNNFATEFECYNKCGALATASACEQEKLVGPCKAIYPRYYYNKATGKCESFVYGGCEGNDNNFETQEDCEAVCVV